MQRQHNILTSCHRSLGVRKNWQKSLRLELERRWPFRRMRKNVSTTAPPSAKLLNGKNCYESPVELCKRVGGSCQWECAVITRPEATGGCVMVW